jgi:hypothetical protein
MPKYGALRILAWLLKVVAVLIAVVGILGLIPSFTSTSPEFYRLSRSIGAVWTIVAILMAFPLWCYADVLQVFMDIEENTRETLEKITAGQEAQRRVVAIEAQNSDCPYCGSKSTAKVPNEIGVDVRQCSDCGRKWRYTMAA